jgi:hypothetical protein
MMNPPELDGNRAPRSGRSSGPVQRYKNCVASRDELGVRLVDDEKFASCEYLLSAVFDHATFCEKLVACGRRQAVDGEMRGQKPVKQRRRGKSATRIDQGGDHACVEEVVILTVLGSPRHFGFGFARRDLARDTARFGSAASPYKIARR